jgi:V/A-type H+-transporting ATPase subunit I
MSGLILSTPELMSKVRVVTMKDFTEQTLKSLQRIGVLHVEVSEELNPVDVAYLEQHKSEVHELINLVNDVLNYTPIKATPPKDSEVLYLRPFNELQSEATSLCSGLSLQHQKIIRKRRALTRLIELKTYLTPFSGEHELKVKDLGYSGKFLFSCIVVIPNDVYDEDFRKKLAGLTLQTVSHAVNLETVHYVIGRSEEQEALISLVAEAGGGVLQVPDDDSTLSEFLAANDNEIADIQSELGILEEALSKEINENLEKLILTKAALLAESERLSVLAKASEAKYVTMIEGWIPESNLHPATAELKDSIDTIFIDSRKPEVEEMPPTKQRNPRAVKPYQVITNLFSIPKYQEWDPTPIIAYSFALFFGIMMGDVIYAIGVLFLARYLLPKLAETTESEGFKLFQRLMYINGIVALIVGLLSGTYLGNFPTKFFGVGNLALVKGIGDIFTTPISFILVAVVIGFIHVNIGHLIALIKGIKEKNTSMIVGKIGLFLLQVSAIPYLMKMMLGVDIAILTSQVMSILGYALIASIVLIVIASILEKGAFMGSIFWLFDITGILGDIMSYARLAGVGLATYYLAFCFNLIAALIPEMLPGVVGNIIGYIVAFFIVVIGHVVNLVLGVLTGFIHSLRLCFVEFLFKFYEGGGREYSPFKLKSPASVLVETKS